MRVPVDKVASAVKMGAAAKREQDVPVRVAVFVDATATRFLIDTVRHALVLAGRTVFKAPSRSLWSVGRPCASYANRASRCRLSKAIRPCLV